MRDILLHLVNMSISASWLILAIIIYRMLFKKAPKWIATVLWCLVGIRLICPITLESRFSLIPSESTIAIEQNSLVIDSGFSGVDATINAYLEGARHEALMETQLRNANIFTVIWLAGFVILVVCSFISYIKLRRSISDAVKYSDGVYQSEKIDSPFVLGIFKPVIYMSYGLNQEQIECVLNHENAHIKRKDHLIKPLGYLLLCISWFNPFVIIAYILLCHDIELACDERVISEMGFDKKKMYSQTLLDCSIPRRLIISCPVAFAEVGVKERVLNIMKMKKTSKIVIAIALIGILAISMMFMTKPFDKNAEGGNQITFNNENDSDVMAAEAGQEQEEMAAEASKTQEEMATEERQMQEQVSSEMNQMEELAKEEKQYEDQIAAEMNHMEEQIKEEKQIEDQMNEQDVVQNETETISENEKSEEYATEGVYVHPVGGTYVITRAYSNEHLAIDFAGEIGTPLVAAISGKVLVTGFDAVNGNYIVIEGSDGTTVYYNNCDTIIAKDGDMVNAGDEIATLGTTGKSTGPHLHFAVADADGDFIDPYALINR